MKQLANFLAITLVIGVVFLLGLLIGWYGNDYHTQSHLEVQNEVVCPAPIVVCLERDVTVIVEGCCSVPTIDNTPTAYPTSTPIIPTPTPQRSRTLEPTNTPSPEPTNTEIPTSDPTPTFTKEPCVCYQWVVHKLGGVDRWKNYCCWSDGCVRAHLRHGDLRGRCQDHDITPNEPDEWNREGCP